MASRQSPERTRNSRLPRHAHARSATSTVTQQQDSSKAESRSTWPIDAEYGRRIQVRAHQSRLPSGPDQLTQLRDQIVELFQALVVDGERAAFAVEGDLGLEAELGGEVALQRLGAGIFLARRFRLLEALGLPAAPGRSTPRTESPLAMAASGTSAIQPAASQTAGSPIRILRTAARWRLRLRRCRRSCPRCHCFSAAMR